MFKYYVEKNELFEQQLQSLIRDGFVKINLPAIPNLETIKNEILSSAHKFSGKKLESIEKIHENISTEKINDFRMQSINYLNSQTSAKNDLVNLALPFFKYVLGSDIAVQKNLNIVMLPPDDPTSILPLHADTWTGHSSFELVLLYPLCPTTPDQNMFVLPLPEYKKNKHLFKSNIPLQNLTEELKNSLHYLDLKVGEAVVLWHATPHGNKINQASTTHWSLNLRFKNIFTPYEQKNMGEYFQPVNLSPFNEFVFKSSTNEPL